MGYRSEVKYVLLFKTEEQLNTFVAHATLELTDIEDGKEILDQMDTRVMDWDTEHKYRLYVSWDDVKWYESYRGCRCKSHSWTMWARCLTAPMLSLVWVRIMAMLRLKPATTSTSMTTWMYAPA